MKYAYQELAKSKVQIKAAGGVRDLDTLIRCRDLGAARVGMSATAAVLEEYRRRVRK